MASRFLSTRKLPLQFVLVAPFVIQLFIAVGLISYFSFRNSKAAVNDLVDQLTLRADDLVDQHLDSYLEAPIQLTKATTDAIDSGLLNADDLKGIQQFIWRQMQGSDITYANYGRSNGDYVGVGDYLGQKTVSETSAATQGKNHSYKIDAQGQPTQLIEASDYDYFEEAWYSETMRAKRPLWSDLYAWDDADGTVSLAASRPVYDAKRQMTGVMSADLSLSDIGKFLRDLQISPNASIFIMERDGSLIASSGTEPVVKVVNQQAQRLNALQSSDPLVQATAQQIQQAAGSFDKIQADQQLEFELDGERQYVRVTPWQDKLGLDWLVVVRLPESDFVAQINQNARTTLLLCMAALATAVLTGLWTTRRIARPIQQLNQASQAIAAGELAQSVKPSRVRELSSLASSFNQMAEQLRDSFAALEESNTALEDRVEERTAELSSTLQELKQMQSQLVQTEKMSSLGQMVAGVAHEINNPVNFIHGNLAYAAQYSQELLRLIDLYAKHYPDPDAEITAEMEAIDLDFLRQDLNKLHHSMEVGTDRIREIVLSLRNFSRLDEAGVKAVDLHEGIDNTLLILESRLKAKPERPAILVSKDYGQLPPVECYAGQLNQVFMNLLTNALDALDEFDALRSAEQIAASPSAIQIQTRYANGWVEIWIADNGAGIPAAVQARLFDPFFTTKPVGQGTGLGLSISYQIITEKHGGQLSGLSAPGEGAIFVIKIPVEQEPKAESFAQTQFGSSADR